MESVFVFAAIVKAEIFGNIQRTHAPFCDSWNKSNCKVRDSITAVHNWKAPLNIWPYLIFNWLKNSDALVKKTTGNLVGEYRFSENEAL